ncbi:DM domain-containing protein [Dirofilaria immitis]
MPKEQYMCQLCANHGIFNQPKKGHKQKCPYRHCPCNLCALNTKRRALDQIERQLKNGSANLQIVPGLINDKIDLCDRRSFSFETKNIDTTDSKDDDYVTTLITLRKAASSHQPIIPLRPLPIKSNSSSGAFCVALPATITKKALKRTAKRMDEAGRKARILENAITNIAQRNRHRSIFHSVEQLAQSG